MPQSSDLQLPYLSPDSLVLHEMHSLHYVVHSSLVLASAVLYQQDLGRPRLAILLHQLLAMPCHLHSTSQPYADLSHFAMSPL